MEINLAKSSQSKRKLPTFADIREGELFAVTYKDEVQLFLKLPSKIKAQVVVGGTKNKPTVGHAYCFNTEREVEFLETTEENFKKVTAVEVLTGDDFVPLSVLRDQR
tara:strand:+ start:173 stop:493 length:321 start_codon:yes stop_codon:yes gene_type:complete